MAVTKVFDENSLVVEPHELTEEDRRAISQAIEASRQQSDTTEIAHSVLKQLDIIKATQD